VTQPTLPSRLGIFGGSFDPVHLGHLLAAQDALEQADLHQVVFMPAARAPLKDRGPGATGEQRLAMLRAAVAGDARFGVSTLELQRAGISYTIDTVRALQKTNPDAELFWIIGADQAGLLPQWREIAVLGELVQFIVLARPGFGLPTVAHRPAGLRLMPVAVHEFAISSSEIRLRLAARKPVRLFLPAPVADLIERGQLYRPTPHAHTA
jgi:nicotinate-nucleotide adenylyltransferase